MGQTTTTTRRYLDMHEVAEMVGCSWRTVLRRADDGSLPWGFKLGNLRRWRPEDIEAAVANRVK